MIRRAEERDVGRLAEILVFAKRTAYRPVFQDDRFSFGGEAQKVGKTDKRQLLYRLLLEGEES